MIRGYMGGVKESMMRCEKPSFKGHEAASCAAAPRTVVPYVTTCNYV